MRSRAGRGADRAAPIYRRGQSALAFRPAAIPCMIFAVAGAPPAKRSSQEEALDHLSGRRQAQQVMASFSSDALAAAFDAIGEAAVRAGARLEIAVYDGSALMRAGNFRYPTEDVDIAALDGGWPEWLTAAAEQLAETNNWSDHWLSDAVSFHLSPLATLAADHILFGSFPRGAGVKGLLVHVPQAEYMLALKLKAMRVNDPAKGADETSDIRNLLAVLKIAEVEAAIAILRRYFPRSAEASEKQRFLLKNMFLIPSYSRPADGADRDAPRYPAPSRQT